MQDASGKPTQQIKTGKASTAHTVFYIIAKDPQGPHIPDNVHPAAMQTSMTKQGEVVWMQWHRPETARCETRGLTGAAKAAQYPTDKNGVKSSLAKFERNTKAFTAMSPRVTAGKRRKG
jgi:hypothetical protein